MPPRQRTGGTTFISRGPADPPAVLSLRGLAEAASAPQVDRLAATAGVLAVSVLGVVATYLADHEGRVHGSWGGLLYWLGQILVFVPVLVAALQLRPPTKSEASLLAMGLGINQYLMMWLYSPDQFRFPDELQHLSATSILNHTGRIFEPNPALPVASGYPGLAEIGSAVSETTGLSITASGMIVAFACRMVFIGALFAMVLRISRSPRAALIAAVLYTTSAHYLFFNAYYVYQAGALAFALVAIWATLRLRWASSIPLTVIAVAASAATVVTHHITSAFLIAVLMILGIASMMAKPRTYRPILIGSGTLVFAALWLAFPAHATIAYFKPPLLSAWSSLTGLLSGGASGGSGSGAPTSKLALVIQLLALIVVFGIVVRTISAMRSDRRSTPFQWLLLIAAGTYFASSALHVAGAQGPELAGRASTFTFLPVAALIAWRADLWITERSMHRRPEPMRMRAMIATSAAVLLMVAGRVGGWPPTWEMLPGKTIVSGFESAITPSGVNAAEWTKAWLGGNNRVGGDITAWTLVASYGGQSPVSEVSPLFYSADWTLADQVFVGEDGVDYLWVDATLARQKSISGSLFFNDSQAGHDTKPLPAANLAKFNNITFMRLVYDDGTIRIYDLRGLD